MKRGPDWGGLAKAPKCPECGSDNVKPWSGSVQGEHEWTYRCHQCGHDFRKSLLKKKPHKCNYLPTMKLGWKAPPYYDLISLELNIMECLVQRWVCVGCGAHEWRQIEEVEE